MPDSQSLRDQIVEAATAQILDLAQHGRMVLDKRGEPILGKDGEPIRRQLSAADINAINRYLSLTRPTKGDNGAGVPPDIQERINRMNKVAPPPPLNTEEDDEATRE